MTNQVTAEFNGTIGTDLSAYSSDVDVQGGGWTQSAANSPELNGSGSAIWQAGSNDAYIDIASADSWLIAPMYLGGADNRGGAEARRDGAAYGSRTCYKYNTLVGFSAQLKIYRITSGSFFEVASGNPGTALVNTGTYSLEPKTNGSSLDFTIGGVSELSTVDTAITTGNNVGMAKLLHTNTLFGFTRFVADDAAPVSGNSFTNFYYQELMAGR